MHEARLFRMLIAALLRRRGGRAGDLLPGHGADRRARTPASAWCLGQNSGVSMAAAYLEPKVARELFGDARAAVATGAPSASAKAIVDRRRLSRDRALAVRQRQPALAMARRALHRLRAGRPAAARPERQAARAAHHAVSRSRRRRITDTWQVIGLRGTGSDDYAVKTCSCRRPTASPARSDADRRETGPLYRFSIFNMFGMAFCAVALGIARTVLDDFIELAKGKTAAFADQLAARQQHHPDPDRPVGGAARRGARLCARQLRAASTSRRRAARTITYEQRVAGRGVTCFAIQQARDVVDFAYHAAGATAIFESNPFERRFRDLHTVTQQSQGASHELRGARAVAARHRRRCGGCNREAT